MPVSINYLDGLVFLPFPETETFLQSELLERFCIDIKDSKIKHYGSLVHCPASVLDNVLPVLSEPNHKPHNTDSTKTNNKSILPYWASTVMEKPFVMKFQSINEAAGGLKAIQRNWASHQFTQFRRGSLIQDALPYINLKPRVFPCVIPQTPMGLFTLLDQHTLIASAQTSSALPAGILNLVEDHENPPSRAYLKIQEALSIASCGELCRLPQKGERCLDAGACPGGWTWVLEKLGCKVIAVDRAPLADSLMVNPNIEFIKHDAFTLTEKDLGTFDWVFSDVICYPERLLEWVKNWLVSSKPPRMICTIKMQGKIDWKIIEQFAEIPNSRVVHLFHNKHEFTWIHT